MTTPDIGELIEAVISAGRCVEYEETTWRTSDYGSVASMDKAKNDLLEARTALESAIEGRLRLAGEDAVVVKRRQLVALEVELRDFLSIAPSARAYVLRRMHDAVAGWLAGSPTTEEK